MRKFLISLLLASALTPAAAYGEAGDRGGRTDRQESASSSPDRPQRAERAARPERPQRAERANVERPQRTERANVENPQRAERVVQSEGPAGANGSNEAVRTERTRPSRAERRAARQDRVQPVEQQVQAPAPVQQVQTQRSGNSLADGLRDIAQNGKVERPDRDDDDHDWSDKWRRDHRYNWYDYRRRYGSLFRLGHYYDPYGWGYNRWSVGLSLWPSYYGSNYWLDDPWMYRLPPAYGPYRWIRYYDDALLVNIYTGQVVDVVHNFFW